MEISMPPRRSSSGIVLFIGTASIEIQDHGLQFQAGLNRALIDFSRKMAIPVVATNDVHYVRPDQAPVHEVLLCVQTQTTMTDPKRMRMETPEFYLKSAAEMEKLFGDV